MSGGRDLLKVEDVTLQYKTPQHLVTATYRSASASGRASDTSFSDRRAAESRPC